MHGTLPPCGGALPSARAGRAPPPPGTAILLLICPWQATGARHVSTLCQAHCPLVHQVVSSALRDRIIAHSQMPVFAGWSLSCNSILPQHNHAHIFVREKWRIVASRDLRRDGIALFPRSTAGGRETERAPVQDHALHFHAPRLIALRGEDRNGDTPRTENEREVLMRHACSRTRSPLSFFADGTQLQPTPSPLCGLASRACHLLHVPRRPIPDLT